MQCRSPLPARSAPATDLVPPKPPPPVGSSPSAEDPLLGLQHSITQILQFGELNDESLMRLAKNNRRMHVAPTQYCDDHNIICSVKLALRSAERDLRSNFADQEFIDANAEARMRGII
jgi:hypothetical protein